MKLRKIYVESHVFQNIYLVRLSRILQKIQNRKEKIFLNFKYEFCRFFVTII